MNKTERLAHLINALATLGFSEQEIKRLRRIASTLHRWREAECNGEIQRDEDNENKPRRMYGNGFHHYIPDREAGALKRLAAIMNAHPDLWAYRQTDPRGAALYVGKRADLKTTENQIIVKARAWGAVVTCTPEGFVLQGTNGERMGVYHGSEEAAARAYLEARGASIPARDLLPLDQHYTRGVAVY